MNFKSMKGIRSISVIALALILNAGIAEEASERDEDEGSEQDGESLSLSPAEQRDAGIETGIIERRTVSNILLLPGEVIPNAYRSAKLTTRIQAQIVKRHARMGDYADEGESMVTLSSVDMADAQGALVVADQEWRRVQSLGRDLVSAGRYTEAQVARQQAMARVIAYGMVEAEVDRMLAAGDASWANGQFDLLAPVSGTVTSDEFVVGELIEPGRIIFEITDETVLWVEARTSANKISGITIGMSAQISPDRTEWREAAVIQIHHRLDETTRTQAVRVEFANDDDWLHPGEFVDVKIAAGSIDNILAVPTDAVVLFKGATVVFHQEDDGSFRPEPVQLGKTFGDWREVLSGADEGTAIVTSGTFFLKSLLLKSELGEGHAH